MTRTDFIATYVLQQTYTLGVEKALADAILAANAIYGVA